MAIITERIFNWLDHLLLRRPETRLRIAGKLPQASYQRLQTAQFRQLVRYAGERSPFYRERFRAYGINPRHVRSHADLGDFFTTSEDLKNRPVEDFLCAPPQVAFETAGTSSGVNKRVYFSYAEMFEYGRDAATGMVALGITRDDVVADGFDYSFWNAPFTAYYSLMAMGCMHVIGGFIEPKEFYDRVKVYRPTVIMGVPTHLVRVTEVAEREGIWPVKAILLGGENLSERTRAYMQSVWKGARVTLAYGQTENFGMNGVECPDKGGYHVSGLGLVSEIINTGEDGYGELVYSTLNRQVMPLIRYRSADITKWATDGPCQCGLRFMPRIAKVVGRLDELINCSMGNISPYWFEDILRDISEVTDDWQVVVRRGERDDIIEFHLEVAQNASPDEIQQRVFANIEARFPDCWRYYQKHFFDIDFRFHPPRTLSQGRKLRRLVDARRDAWSS